MSLARGWHVCFLGGLSAGGWVVAYAVQQLINGITLGMIYGLIAVGYTMVYGIIGMINFAHGDVFMVGAFLSLISLLLLSVAGVTSVPLALALTLRVRGGAGRAVWLDDRARGLPAAARLVPPGAADQRHRHVAGAAELHPDRPGRQRQADGAAGARRLQLFTQDGFAVQVTFMQIAIVVTTLVVLGVFTWLVTRTPLGRAMRACEQDMRMAGLLGIDTDRTISLTFVIGAALAAVAG